jgi:hypothetical protein
VTGRAATLSVMTKQSIPAVDFPRSGSMRTHAACPDGNEQRIVELAGFRLKGDDYLQVRVILQRGDYGICDLAVQELDDEVRVRAVACYDPEATRRARRSRRLEEIDSPCNYVLDRPLGNRIVVDLDSDVELPLYIPHWDEDRASEYVPRPPGDLWQQKLDEWRRSNGEDG